METQDLFNMDIEKKNKQEIIKSANAVKRKVKQMQESNADNNIIIDTMFKPITEPLNRIASDSSWKSREKNIETTDKIFTNYSEEKEHSSIDPEEEYAIDDSDEAKLNKTILDYSSASDGNNSETIDSDNDKSISFRTVESDSASPRPGSLSWSLTSEVFKDVPFGVRLERGKHMMGTARVIISDHSVTIAGQKYLKTPGLSELLFNKTPNFKLLRESDLENYKRILLTTNAHRRDFDPRKPIKSNKGIKYLNIIRPMFKNVKSCTTSTESLAQGFGLPSLKRMKKNTDYVYWDDPNELVDRLKLLIASRDAGNTGLNGEILSIVEELRENGIIN